ncbi:solute carrier family 2, facilitated glucose transporter member 6-like [Cydia strobilella]|uniref:solute carrier family 2, facilitated glucose transporter member 6-like n=1 Tax=Cydia strobilella TaxID=1100964 RepID=UPI003005BB87
MRIQSFLRQCLGTTIMSFPKFLLGSGTVWPSYALLILQSASTPLSGPISLFEEALMGSLPYISSIFMSPFGGVIVDKFGRKWSGIFTNAVVAVSWVFVIYGTTSPMLLIGRCLFGVSGGLLMQVAWAFAAEVSEDACRGFMSSLPSVMYAFGALVSIILGWVTSYHNIAYINFGLAIANAFTMWLLPETPVYLCLIGKHEEALKSLSFYRASTTKDKAVIDEMAEIKANQDNKQKSATLVPTEEPVTQDPEKQNLANEDFVLPAKLSALQYFRISPGARWSFIVVTILLTLSIFTGVIAIQVYGGTLFLKATPSLSPDLCAVLLASILMVGAISGAACTDLFGRRILLISASTINGVCMVLLGVMVRWPFGPEWLVPAVILVFCFIFNLGGGMIPYVLLAEAFVPEVKGFSQSIMMLWLYLVNFIILLVFVPAVEYIGLQVVFFVFAGCAFACTLCTYYMIPETKGMNPYDIEELFTTRIKEGRRWARPTSENK